MKIIAFFFLASGIILSILVYIDMKKHRQSMRIMEIVWPLTMLWASWRRGIIYTDYNYFNERNLIII